MSKLHKLIECQETNCDVKNCDSTLENLPEPLKSCSNIFGDLHKSAGLPAKRNLTKTQIGWIPPKNLEKKTHGAPSTDGHTPSPPGSAKSVESSNHWGDKSDQHRCKITKKAPIELNSNMDN